MAITSILATATGAATSAEIVVNSGESVRVGLRGFPMGTIQQIAVMVEGKADDGTFYELNRLAQDRATVTVMGPLTFRTRRITGFTGVYVESTTATATPTQTPWSYAAAAGGIVNSTTAAVIKTASGAGVKNYLTSLQIVSTALGLATEVVVRNGAAGPVLWRGTLTTAGALAGITARFQTPIESSANTLLEVATLTATLTGAVFINAQGYSA